VIEFPNYTAALECYRSSEYAKAMAIREGKSVMGLAIVEGYNGPQPHGYLACPEGPVRALTPEQRCEIAPTAG
jgi:Domain of unknown function (DUF1330)